MIHIRKSSDGQFYFTVNANNGKVLVTSETYKRKRNAFKGIRSLRSIFDTFNEVMVKDHSTGQTYEIDEL